MKILAIETSCDETGISILEVKGGKNPTFKILANALASQSQLHAHYGGVYPTLAKREHIKNLPILLEQVLKKSKVKKFDLIAVTSGPGLEPALWTGITFAQDLSKKWKVPVVPVNHMEGHILSVFGKRSGTFSVPKINFPVLSLLVSGGHTELVLTESWQKYKLIGETLDDAAGEAYDKVARMMSLPYPGGPQISRLAEEVRSSSKRGSGSASARTQAKIQQNFMGTESGRTSDFVLPRPMIHSKDFNFSFSGLKTAVLYLIKRLGDIDDATKSAIALEFENAVVETLIHKTKKAVELYKVKTLIVAGGVAANKHLRREIKNSMPKNISILFPAPALSTDNSIMIGMAGYFSFLARDKKGVNPSKIKAEGGLAL